MFSFKSLVIGILLLISGSAMAAAPVETGLFNNKAIYGYDPVAYFTLGEATEGDKAYSYEWRGATWYFVNQQHRGMFMDNPEQYAPQYGGYCAYAMADDSLAGIDEDAFTIYQGRLYLNYSMSVMEDWRKDKDAMIERADKFYPLKVDL